MCRCTYRKSYWLAEPKGSRIFLNVSLYRCRSSVKILAAEYWLRDLQRFGLLWRWDHLLQACYSCPRVLRDLRRFGGDYSAVGIYLAQSATISIAFGDEFTTINWAFREESSDGNLISTSRQNQHKSDENYFDGGINTASVAIEITSPPFKLLWPDESNGIYLIAIHEPYEENITILDFSS